MKIWKKALSVGLSLALCASMVLPSFAAQVLNNENKDQFIDKSGALLGHDGNGGSGDQYDYELGENLELEKTLIIKNGVDASLDLKGNDLKLADSAKGSVINVKSGGKLELDDSTAAGEGDDYTAGHVTGGKKVDKGGGVLVEKGGELDMKGGIISGNAAISWGGGIGNDGTVVMSGGQISNNTANLGGGVFNSNQFTMVNGEISKNTTNHDGGGVFNGGDFIMEDGKINGNTTTGGGSDGGGMYICGYWNINGNDKKASFTMNGGEVADNVSAGGGGGISSYRNDSFIMNGGAIVRNQAAAGRQNGVEGEVSCEISYGNVTICNYGKDGLVEATHEFDGGKATDAGAAGHTVNCIHGCGQPSDVMPHTYGAWVTVNAPQVGVTGERRHTCTACGHAETEPIDPLTDGTELELGDEEIPLAGIFTRGDAIGYLWRQAGEPEWELSSFEDVPEDHEWAVAIGWAQDMGIARADEEGNFRPDDLVLRSVESLEVSPEGELQEFLNWYAAYAGVELDEGELFIQLEGAWDDVIMGEEAQVIFDEFFAKLEAALSQAA